MYAKIFAQIYDGTLCTNHPWQALVTFQQLLILADQDGTVDMTARAISRRTGIPIEIIDLGIEELLRPDPESRTPDEDGRRIIPLVEGREWGWRVVNYVTYRSLKREEDRREYHRRYYQQNRSVAALSTKNVEAQHAQQIQPIAEAEAEANAEANAKTSTPNVLAEKPAMTLVEVSPVDKLECQHQKVIEIFHSKLPELPRVMVWNDTRKRTLSSLWANVVKTQKFKTSKEVLEYFTNYFDFIGQSDFLCGRAKTVNDRKPFIADLEWVIRPSNFAKIVEGKYHA